MDVVSELKHRWPRAPENCGDERCCPSFDAAHELNRIMAGHPTVVDVSHSSYKNKLKS
ncbi:hypothetical protein ACFOHY_21500 [Rhizobium rosettiformans]|uniref:hypothetical protein n=1 Tax=Rhizobium rosettiformans TaxID=1368430 RepID=UPI00361C0B4C